MSFSSLSAAIMFFMATGYANNEWAYFKNYPYLEMAARHNQKLITPEHTSRAVTVQAQKKIMVPPPAASPFSEPGTTKPVIISQQFAESSFSAPRGDPKEEKRFRAKKIPATPQIMPQSRPQPENNPRPQNKSYLKENTPKKTIPDHWRHAARQGYAAYGTGDYAAAITHFETAIKFSDNDKLLHLQLAYAYKSLGQNAKAGKSFKAVIDQYGKAAAPFHIRREIEQLENRFNISAYSIYRDEPAERRRLTGPDLTQSQAGLEVSYQPEKIGFNNGRKTQIYGRLLSGMEMDQVDLNPDSYQAGIGLRFKPYANHNLVLSAERLIKVGDFARNDWMLRAGYSRDHGTDYREDKKSWWSYSLYLDAAIIDPLSPDIFLTAQAISGFNIAISQGLILQPRLTGLTTWQKDSFQQASLMEAGPGLNLKYYFNDTIYEAYRSHLDLTVEYRLKIFGNSIGGSGPIVSLMIYF